MKRFWAGLSTDLVIEQALIRRGLTRGRGMSEIQSAQWLLSMPACSDVNTSIQEYTGPRYETSDLLKDVQSSRVAREIIDTDTNSKTGTVGEENANVDAAKSIGEDIFNEMEDKTNAVKIGDDEMYMDVIRPNSWSTESENSHTKNFWDLHKTIQVLGEEVRKLLVFIHAFTGCDTTSRLRHVKQNVSDEKVRNHAGIFLKDSLHDEFELACSIIQLVITTAYGGRQSKGFGTFEIFAAYFHSYIVYLQVQTWLGRGISPTNWGWMTNGDKLVHVKTTLTAALERLMKMIRCKNCDSKPCTCRKHGLCCTAACGECHGLSCSNKGELFDGTGQDLTVLK
ncbi:hypothetical protein MAR_005354 [Mya arenaria]|uniref:Uncharacterized protein n=1 Tax=Mya arenaria TaxID=6604 RepID=A0ABY7F244_MYAAR|nr:hypothetical protein MAR_005354 [Mya arenaria]